MSAQMWMSKMTSSAVTNCLGRIMRATSSSSSTILHPAIPLRAFLPCTTSRLSHQYRRHHHPHHPRFSTTAAVAAHHRAAAVVSERQSGNVARLYARRCLELATASVLTRRSVADMEQQIDNHNTTKNNKHSNSSPSTWEEGHDEFSKRREEFGDSVGQLGSTRIARVWAAGSRLFNLALLASPYLVLAPASYLFPSSQYVHNSVWSYALWSVEKAGPTFIKLTQWASTRSDLFSSEFCGRFAKLQDETRGHSWAQTHAMLQSQYGSNYNTDLLHITQQHQRKPIGSGCIAQVYQATLQTPVGLHPKGTTVALKIQHPHILHKVCVDFYILQRLAQFLEWIPHLNLDYLSVKDSVDQFRGIMLPQLDLRCEARNLNRFRRDFVGDEDIDFPQPLNSLTSDTILVESFVHGEPILKFLDSSHTVEDRQTLATIGLRTAMKMIFLHDFVHGDLHPGNILVDRNEKNKLRMNMIDCGLVVEMGEREHHNLVQILGALVKKDGISAGQLMVDTSKRCQASGLDVELFVKGIHQIVVDDEQSNFLENVGDYLAEICYLACRHKVKLEASFINAALACEIMEGIASALYPDMQVQHIALPMVVKAEAMHSMRKHLSFLN